MALLHLWLYNCVRLKPEETEVVVWTKHVSNRGGIVIYSVLEKIKIKIKTLQFGVGYW